MIIPQELSDINVFGSSPTTFIQSGIDLPGRNDFNNFVNSLFSTALKGALIATRARFLCSSAFFCTDGAMVRTEITDCFLFGSDGPCSFDCPDCSLAFALACRFRPLQFSQCYLMR